MTRCEVLYANIAKAERNLKKAMDTEDFPMIIFFTNAIKGLEQKLYNSTIEELSKLV